jgi:hypothetical protein
LHVAAWLIRPSIRPIYVSANVGGDKQITADGKSDQKAGIADVSARLAGMIANSAEAGSGGQSILLNARSGKTHPNRV